MTTSLEYDTCDLALASQMLLDKLDELDLAPGGTKTFDEVHWIAIKVRDAAKALYEKTLAELETGA